MDASPYDSPLRWQVTSGGTKGNGPYIVDLGAWAGNGECQCWDFQCKRLTAARAGVATRCKHIPVARAALQQIAGVDLPEHELDEVIRILREQDKNTE